MILTKSLISWRVFDRDADAYKYGVDLRLEATDTSKLQVFDRNANTYKYGVDLRLGHGIE
ncbi:hypothetical protein PGT21_009913 [Puccinia graminis f. sp. tritici]|uniref:Uncharacterized protein n=1 Tax=Puccinia graminis f. sp. tritici TaxID=56615 RepID=A0A5B0LSZ2_PUCGR|nr:hypothetical protein PGT21_009913 [Puccinia graminis f. sp. tritici]